MQTLYIETSIVSFLRSRQSAQVVSAARQLLTRRWWELERQKYELVTSQYVIDESSRGHKSLADERLLVLSGIPLIDIPDEVPTLADELVTSLAVLAELERGDFPGKEQAIKLFSRLPVEDITDAVAEIAEAYIAHRLMPNDPTGDALHLAIASYHKCDFLVTWNCKHLANANKFGHIRRVNGILGLMSPSLVTPLELLAEGASDAK